MKGTGTAEKWGSDDDIDPTSDVPKENGFSQTENGDVQGAAKDKTIEAWEDEWFYEWDQIPPGYGFADITPDTLYSLAPIDPEYAQASQVPEFPTPGISLLLIAGIAGAAAAILTDSRATVPPDRA